MSEWCKSCLEVEIYDYAEPGSRYCSVCQELPDNPERVIKKKWVEGYVNTHTNTANYPPLPPNMYRDPMSMSYIYVDKKGNILTITEGQVGDSDGVSGYKEFGAVSM